MRNFIRLAGLAITFFIVMIFSGCKADASRPAGFITNDAAMTKHDNLPFHRVWYDKDINWNDYNKVIVAPINTDHLAEATWWDSISMAWDRQKDTALIADHMRTAVRKAFNKKEDNRFRTTSAPGQNTLLLEIALVELAPTKAFLNAAGLLVGVTIDHGMVAIEARIKDSSSSRVIATFADREQGKSSVVNVDDYTWFGHAEKVIETWSQQIVATLNTNFKHNIKDSETLTLEPW